MERICPRCGTSSAARAFVGEICLECSLSGKREKWPAKIEIEACQKCGKMRKGKEWKEFHPSLVSALAALAMKGVPGHYNYEAGVWEGIWEQGGESAPFSHPLPVLEKKSVCPSCNRMSSGYFEGIIQLRGDSDKAKKWAEKLSKQISKITFVPKVEEMHGGYDIYIGEKKEVPEILFHHGFKYLRTEKLAGEKNGKRLYRSTFLIRLE